MKRYIAVIAAPGLIGLALHAQNVSTYAGNPQGQTGITVNSPSNLKLSNPAGIGFDGAGRLWLSEEGGHVIRMFHNNGQVYVRAGTYGQPSHYDAAGIVAKFNKPTHVALDADGNIYVADAGNHVIRKVAKFQGMNNTQAVTTVAGTPTQSGHQDGAAGNARFNSPTGIAVAPDGTIYVADKGNHVIRKITTSGQVSTLAGVPGQSGNADGSGANAQFNYPVDIIYSGGDLYVADSWNRAIRKVTPNGQVSTVATLSGGLILRAIARDGSGNFYAAVDCRIFKYDGTNATLFAGGQFGNDCGHIDGPALSAKFNPIYDLEIKDNYLYVVERQDVNDSDYIRRINLVTTTVETLTKGAALTVYPNPTSDVLYVELPVAVASIRYEIWDLLGQRMQSGWISSSSKPLDVSDLAPGIYFLKLYLPHGPRLFKISVR